MIKNIIEWVVVWAVLCVVVVAVIGLIDVAAMWSFSTYMQPWEWSNGMRAVTAFFLICMAVFIAFCAYAKHKEEQNK